MRGRMSSVFSLVVTSGPRLGDIESGTVASLTSARFSMASGGLACVAGTGADGRRRSRRWRPTTADVAAVRCRCPAGRLRRGPGTPPGASRGTTARPRARRPTGRARTSPASRRGAPPSGARRRASRHSSWRPSATDTGAVLSAISRASACARRQQLVRRVDAADQAAAQRLLRVEDAAGRDPLHRLADADDARQEPARARLRHDAAAREDEADLRPLGREPDVHRQRHRDADADGRPVDRRDHRLRAVEDPQRDLAAAVARHVPAVAGLALAPVERRRRPRRGRRRRRSRGPRRSRSTARTSSSASARSNAAISSRRIVSVKAFSRSGRFSVIVRTPSATLGADLLEVGS